MKLIISNEEYDILINGTNITNTFCIIRIVNSNPTHIDKLFQDAVEFFIRDENDNDVQYDNIYSVVYTELRHNQDLGFIEDQSTGEYIHKYGDVITVYLVVAYYNKENT